MTFSFNPLWKILIDKGMTKEDLRTALKLSPSTIAKMSKGEYVSMRVVDKICVYFGVQPGELMTYVAETPIQEFKKKFAEQRDGRKHMKGVSKTLIDHL